MCGIAAVITPDKNFPAAILRSMRDRMLHRGPDAAGEWMETSDFGTIALGHRRLAIIDLTEKGAQPMFSDDERYAMIYNGEIYNYIELRDELISHGHVFKTESDSEVLLRSYIHWGRDALKRLNGMFSFCIWDRHQKILFCARDRFGEKPFYMAKLPGGGIAIASEIKALFAHPAIKPEINEQQALNFLKGYASYSSPETFFAGVERLPPAHAVIFDENAKEIERWRYWTPDYNSVRKDQSEEETIDEFLSLLKNSLKMRLRSDVKVGACLSGGLDSSTIVGLLKSFEQKGTAKLSHTYSARFDQDPTVSEGNYIDMMLKQTGFSSKSITPDASRIIDEFERLHWHQEQPFLSASMYLEWCVVRKARETGTIVLLDGQGADEVLCGYQYYFTNLQKDSIFSGRWISLLRNTIGYLTHSRHESEKYINSERRITPIPRLFSKDMYLSLRKSLADKLKRRHQLSLPGLPDRKGLSGSFRYDMALGLLYQTLPNNLHSADCNGMAHSIETRFPFLDYTLVDWCIGLPDKMLINNGWLKYTLRRAIQDIVPESIQWRGDKVGYAAPQDEWLRNELKDWGRQKLFDGPVSRLSAYDRNYVDKLWNDHQGRAQDNSGTLWRYISLNQWLEMFDKGIWKNGLEPSVTELGTARQ